MGHKLVYDFIMYIYDKSLFRRDFLEMTKTALFIKVNLMSC